MKHYAQIREKHVQSVQIMHVEKKQNREESIVLNCSFLLPIAILGIIKDFYHGCVFNAISFLVIRNQRNYLRQYHKRYCHLLTVIVWVVGEDMSLLCKCNFFFPFLLCISLFRHLITIFKLVGISFSIYYKMCNRMNYLVHLWTARLLHHYFFL